MSKLIHTPSLANIEEHNQNSATFVIEPLHTGYGMTLGNSMRRVLLSSVSGASITAFKIEGVTHEFTTVKGVREDVVNIMLNLKSIRFKMYTEEPQTIRLTHKGKGEVTAGEFKVNADLEIVNPDSVIATVAESDAEFIIDVIVETGRGYRTVEEGANRKPSDMIAVDAIFSPVLRVRYKVEDTRVGQITDLDKLVITVDTDGSITPKDAFEEAAAILVNQYNALAGSTKIEAMPASKTVAPDFHADDSDDPAELMVSVEDLNLTARTTNALINNDIHTLKDLFSLGDAELRDLKGFGQKALDEVKDKLTELEL